MRLLFEQDERGEPVADEHNFRDPSPRPRRAARGTGEGPADASAEGESAKETSPIQKFLRRFGIK